jgi:hypothetical protein
MTRKTKPAIFYYDVQPECGHHVGVHLTAKDAKALVGTKGVCYYHGVVTIKAVEKVI